MSSVLFNRAARVKVGLANDKLKPSGFKGGTDIRVFDGLKIGFSVEKVEKGDANMGNIQVYNLGADSRSFCEQLPLFVVLEVGYRPPNQPEVLEALFQGAITSTKGLDKKSVNKAGKITNERQGVDWITTFEAGDAEAALQNAHIDKTFEKGVDLNKVVEEVAGTFGQAIGTLKGVTNKIFNNGLTLSGGSKEIMENLAKEGEAIFSIQDGAVQVLKPQQTTGEEAVVISKETGMIGAPIKREDGIEVVSLIQPNVYPGRKMFLKSELINGEYKIVKANFNGDTHDGNWTVKIEAVEVEE